MNMINLGFIAAVVTFNFELCFSACARAEYEVDGECCPMCAPGNRVFWHCTVDTSTTCVPCPASTYIDEPNDFEKCFTCSVCDASNGLRVKRTCISSADTVCEPLKGFYCIEQNKDSCRFAMGHSQCSPGQYIKQTGTARTDTVCGNCMEGTYSNGFFTACQPHTKCETEGLKEIKPGTVSSDAECGNSTPVGIIVGAIVGAVCILLTAIGISFIYFKLKHKSQTPETDTNNCQLPVQESVSMESRCDREPIVLKDSRPVILSQSSCSCVAGTAVCNHIVALLYQAAHYSQLGLSAVPPVRSCTEAEQSWHKPRTMGIKPGPVNKMVLLSARPKERKLAEGLRSTLYKGVTSELPDLSVLQVAEVYKDFASATAPLITTIGISSEDSLVDSAFGKVQAGSVLSYQQPPATTRNISTHPDAPAPPPLPLHGYSLDTSVCLFVHSKHEQLHMRSLEVTLEMAHNIETATKDQSASLDWHSVRKPRVTSSRFREVCHVRGQSSAEHLAERVYKGTRQTAHMKRGLQMESAAVEEYCLLQEVNYYPCGFMIHPDAPWLGASPDGIIFDPKEHHVFGLLEIKCPNVQSYVDCPYLKFHNGTPELKEQHAYYWQVQGQMLISGLDWCDFVIYAQDDMMVQRIYKDIKVFQTIREKADHFFFYFYLPRCLQV